MSATATLAPELSAPSVSRSPRRLRWPALAAAVVLLVLAALPAIGDAGMTSLLVDVFVLLSMASMWNLLAGYAGLVSVGQQAFVGAGAYVTLMAAQNGVEPFVAIPIATVGACLLAVPVGGLVLRLRGGYFAIATWVVADALQLLVGRFPSLGGGTGASLPGFAGIDPTMLGNATYWASLAVAVATLAMAYLVLRGRLGLVLTAIRDDEIGARSIGGRVTLAKGLVFLLAAAGTGAAGAILIISQLSVQASSVFSVNWSAEIIFVTLIGGIGSLEGPVVGTIVFFALQQALAPFGAWYLIVLGVIAVLVALFAPRGLWGLVADRFELRPFPVGYWLRSTAGGVPPATGGPG